jgi:hypothetical protein
MVHLFSRAAASQAYVDGWLDPQPFWLSLRLAQAVLNLGLAILYAPILPISPLIGVVAMVLHYAADQYMALRHSLKPRAFDVQALHLANVILRLLPLAQVWHTMACSDIGRQAQL